MLLRFVIAEKLLTAAAAALRRGLGRLGRGQRGVFGGGEGMGRGVLRGEGASGASRGLLSVDHEVA